MPAVGFGPQESIVSGYRFTIDALLSEILSS